MSNTAVNPAVAHQNQLTMTGWTEPNALITLYDGNDMVGMAVADAGGSWRVVSDRLADGLHVLSTTATDLAGNVSGKSVPYYVSISASSDMPPPSQTAAAPEVQLDLESDTGASSTDHVTAKYSPRYVGQAAPGSWVELVIDGVKGQFGALVDAQGNWHAPGAVLSEGIHTVSVIVHDSDGNASAPSTAIKLTVDTTAPMKPDTPILVPHSDDGSFYGLPLIHTQTPVLTGTAEAGARVDLYECYPTPTKIGSAVADSNGAWSVTTGRCSDGGHIMGVLVTDLAGNSSWSDNLWFQIDTNAPMLTQESETGDTGDQTSLTTPAVIGKTVAGASVALYDGSDVVGTAVADTSGVWHITTTALSEGQHNLVAHATDSLGNALAPSGILALTIDTRAPLTAPSLMMDALYDHGSSSSDQVTNASDFNIQGTAEAHTIIRVYVDDVELVSRPLTGADGNWGSAMPALSDGTHRVSVTSEDLAGNVGPRSTEAVVTIDTKAPDAPSAPKLDSRPAGGNPAPQNFTGTATPPLTGSAEAGATVILYDGANQVGSAVADNQGVWRITASALTAGEHSLTVTATDVAGNTSAGSAPLSLVVDPTTLGLAAVSDTGRSNSDHLTSLIRPVIRGKASAGATVLLFDGDTQVGKAVADSAGAWSITTAKLADGAHHLAAATLDAAGYLSAPSSELLVTIDTKANVSVPLLDPLSDSGRSQSDGITNVAAPHLSGTADAGATVNVYDGGVQVGTAVADDNGAWSIITKALAAGKHSLTAKATDAAGNVSATSPALSMTIDNKAPAAPTTLDLLAAADTGASTADNITSINTPVVSGTAEANARVDLYDGATLLGSATAENSGNWKITSTLALADGVHNLTAEAIDVAGNSSSASSALEITVDTVTAAPALLDMAAASDRGASSTDNITNLATPSISGKAEAGATVVLYDGVAAVGKAVAAGNGAWTITSARLADGMHNLTAIATDVAGNVSQASDALAVTIDTKAVLAAAAPRLDAQSDSGFSNSDRITNITTPTVSGSTEGGATVTLYDGRIQVGSTTANNNGAWNITSKALAAGNHNLTVKVTDVAGNLSASSAALALIIDNRAPAAPSALDLQTAYDTGTSRTDNKTAITTPAIGGKAEANSSISLYDGATLLGSATADSSGAWKIVSAVSLDVRVHSLTAKATDIAGNVSAASAALSVTIDSSATGLTLAGTSAADNFMLNAEAGAIKITGFAAAKDHLVLAHDYNGLSLSSAADVVALGHAAGSNLVIDLGAGHEVTLVGLTSLPETAITLV